MKFDNELLNYLCGLSKVSLKESEREEILLSLKELVEEFSSISNLEDEPVEIENSEYLTLREDISINCNNIDKIKDNFPFIKDDFLEVPKILNEE
ncbi:MAG: aspartyl/glutamyl-tRNA amidotransferase subunit C [Caldisericia bacterium]|nr:aspartyl/glutamyl-tRNA amidotransferase subunit C [Caldisericia bacterium]MDD5689784.1 aspartyl/glutamyl-tRNA amidotransferase subunit C [Caldisericia bacterium]